ncbi:MAG: ATP-binding protein, partial [Acidimicrobiia bacterium]
MTPPASPPAPPGPLPEGTVTFLLTDIEGSTAAWEADRAAMAAAVARHYEILDRGIEGRRGTRPVEQGEGDSVVAVFTRASDALQAAVDIQLAFAAEAWPSGAVPAVRMAVHTGDARLRDEGNYMGPAVIRTARLRAIGHGGQILCSRTTAELAADDLPPAVTLADLGAQRLRDLGRPEHVYQVCHSGLRRDFPALRSLDATPNNLPVHLTTFIGRDAELDELSALVARHRLVTLTGPGGCGKTRLAARAAAEVVAVHADGIWWVELAALSDPALVTDAVLGVLSVPDGLGRSALQRLTAHLATCRVLLVLDNCEHVLDACATVSEAVLRACPGVRLVATSREALGVPSEVTWPVPPLTLPAAEAGPLPLDSLDSYDAVRLFVDRAIRARPNFTVTNETAPVIAEICTRLDGIPLAIELAAARVRLLSPQEIQAGLQDRFRLLTGGARGALPRQQTLEASVAWSHEQLSDDERVLFRRLAVFAGGFTLDAAEAVCAPGGEGPDRLAVLDLLDGLVAKSLVMVDDGAGPETRYRMLETIRQFAALALSRAQETAALRDAHLGFCLASAGRMEERLIGPNPAVIRWAAAESDNYRVALDWALSGADSEAALHLARPLAFLLGHRGRIREAREWLERALALPAGPPVARGEALWMQGFLLWNWGDAEAGKAVAAQMLELARAAGNARLEGRAHEVFCWAYLFSDPAAAKASIDAARPLAEATGDAWVLMDHACEVAFIAMRSDDHAEMDRLVGDALALAGRHGSNYFLGWNRFTQGMSALRRGRLPEARAAGEEGLRLSNAIGDAVVRSLHEHLVAEVALAEGAPQAVLERVDRALVDCERAGSDVFLASLLGTRARALMALAHPEAPEAAQVALLAAEGLRDPWVHGPVALARARSLIETGDLAAAGLRVDEARR